MGSSSPTLFLIGGISKILGWKGTGPTS